MRATSTAVPLCAAVALALAGATSPARAADPAADAAGIALFNEGKALAGGGDWEHACPKFAEAARLHPAAAIELNLADCFEHVNKLASAWGAWKEAEIMARNAHDAEREQVAAQRGQALAPLLPKLAIVVPPGTRVPGLEVRKDGALVGEGQWGSSLPADLGSHTVDASAPGHKAWSTVVRVETNGSAASVEIPALEVLQAPTLPGADATASGAVRKLIGFAAVGVGGAGLAVGAITLGVDYSDHATLAKQCPMARCAAILQPAVDTYHTLGLVSSTSLAVGGALAVTGVVLVLVAPSAKPQAAGVSPVVGPGYAGLSGRF